ncbi:MAG: hypothetical protein HZB82_04275 [Deltaproteobacteria bacterium]|nr:hypothetical protein [Deltaproteobacteria bacterium]
MKKQPLICIKCNFAGFLDPKKEVCWFTGGLYCKKLDIIVGKYEECKAKDSTEKGKK